ncbi:MAG: 4Fe-4S binding protein, partial [Desulfocapsaceae bacterium]|nr:4Fe-4S binding protein [Desulfocapsaceae bacterium]
SISVINVIQAMLAPGLMISACGLLVLGMNLVTRRFYCRYFCPLGATLNLIGSRRKLRVRMEHDRCTVCGPCDRRCPLGLSPVNGMAVSLYCWNCGECVDVCQSQALAFQWRHDSEITNKGTELDQVLK